MHPFTPSFQVSQLDCFQILVRTELVNRARFDAINALATLTGALGGAMTDKEAQAIEYHERRRRQEWERVGSSGSAAAREAHAELARLHDLARLFSKTE